MRKFLISLLLASALAPAAAQAKEGGVLAGIRSHAEKSEKSDNDRSSSRRSSDNRPQKAERPARAERSSGDRPARVERQQREPRTDRAFRGRRFDGASQPVQVVEPVRQVRTTDSVRRVRRGDRDGNSLLDGFRAVGSEQQYARDGDGRRDRDGDRRWSRDRDRDGQRWSRDRDRDGRRWSGDWRRDHRYDWRSHRSRYSSLYRFGRYYDPYRYGYRRFSIGFTLWPSYYGSNFWLNDPWQYRLPPAYGPYRWVRYYDDALLVNIYSGEVVDVIYNFFW